MAFPTAVNDQITDAVTQSNVKVLGDAPAQATALLYQGIAQALALAAENATAQQQNAEIFTQSVNLPHAVQKVAQQQSRLDAFTSLPGQVLQVRYHADLLDPAGLILIADGDVPLRIRNVSCENHSAFGIIVGVQQTF